MKVILATQTMDIPEGVKLEIKTKQICVSGPRGELKQNFKHLNLDFQLIEGDTKLKVNAWFGSRKTIAATCMAISPRISHVIYLITDVTKGYRYKMRFVYAHFPINSSISNEKNNIKIRNFLGEKVRRVNMLANVTVMRSARVKDEIVLEGNDIELISRSATLINQKCHVKKKDIQKFLDGIYVSEKATIVEEGGEQK